MDVHVVAVVCEHILHVLRVGKQVGVALHDALGEPGRPARVTDRRERVVADPVHDLRRQRAVFGQVVEVDKAVGRRRVARMHKRAQRRAALYEVSG